MTEISFSRSCCPDVVLPSSVALSAMDFSISSLEVSVASEQRQRRREERGRRKKSRRFSTETKVVHSLSDDENKARWQSAEPQKPVALQSLSLPRRKRSNPDLFGLEDDDDDDDDEVLGFTQNGTVHRRHSLAATMHCNPRFQAEELRQRRRTSLISAGTTNVSAASPRLPSRTRSTDQSMFSVSDHTPRNYSFRRRERQGSEDSFEAPSLPMRKASFIDSKRSKAVEYLNHHLKLRRPNQSTAASYKFNGIRNQTPTANHGELPLAVKSKPV